MKREPPFYGGARVALVLQFFFFPIPFPFLPSLVRLHRAFHVFFCFFPGEIYSIRRFKLILILYRDGADGEIVAVFLTSVEARRRDEGQ